MLYQEKSGNPEHDDDPEVFKDPRSSPSWNEDKFFFLPPPQTSEMNYQDFCRAENFRPQNFDLDLIS
jgi:hypothetical protein